MKIECLDYIPDAHPHLRLIGDVEIILDSRCARETTRRYPTSPSYALGGAAVSAGIEWALEHIGEFICVDGKPVWTPSDMDSYTPQVESKGKTIYTPFLIDWDGVVSATFAFEEQDFMPSLYRALFDKITELGESLEDALIATIILAETTTEDIHDKAMIKSPTAWTAPSNAEKIIHKMNLKDYFLRNVTHKCRQDTRLQNESEFLIIVGVGVDLTRADRNALGDLLSRAFYLTPGKRAEGGALVHNHAIVWSKNTPILDSLLHIDKPDIPKAAARLLKTQKPHRRGDILCMVHIENNTCLHRGLVGVGIIPKARIEYP